MSMKELEESLKITKITLLFSGLKMEPGKRDILFKILFQINFLWLFTDVVGELTWLVEGIHLGKSFLELSYIAPCATISILSLAKSLFIYIHQDLFIQVVAKLKAIHPELDDEQMTDESESNKDQEQLNDVIKRNVKESTNFIKSLIRMDLVLCSVVVLAFCFLPITAMGYEYWKTGTCEVTFPFTVKFFFDPYKNNVWPFVYFHQVWSTFVAFNQTFGPDTFLFAFCVYCKMHFCILQRRFQDAIAVPGEEGKQRFIDIVVRHQELIHMVDQMEILFSKSTLFNIITSSILICLSGFNVTSSGGDMSVMFSFLAFLSMSLTQIFLMCYFGDMLKSSSLEISDAVYNSTWYRGNRWLRRKVLFVMLRGRKPCKLTAARFADLNLTAFTTILSRSWSLFALLKTVYK